VSAKRAAVHLDPELHEALRVKAERTERPVSDLVDEAVRLSLVEDRIDLDAFEERAGEPAIPFDEVLKNLRARGRL
jgi:predicted DNA-binding protein